MVVIHDLPLEDSYHRGWFEVKGSGQDVRRYTVPYSRPRNAPKARTQHLVPSIAQVKLSGNNEVLGYTPSPFEVICTSLSLALALSLSSGPSPAQATKLPQRRMALPKTVPPPEVNLPPNLDPSLTLPFGQHQPTPKPVVDMRRNIMVPRAKTSLDAFKQEEIGGYVVSTPKNKFSPLNPLTNLDRVLFAIEPHPAIKQGRRAEPGPVEDPAPKRNTEFRLPPYSPPTPPPRILPMDPGEMRAAYVRARSVLDTPPDMRSTGNAQAHWIHERNAKPKRNGPVFFEARHQAGATPRYLCGIPKRSGGVAEPGSSRGLEEEGQRSQNGSFQTRMRTNNAMLPKGF
jgi:hypothetical protein